jgi:hypothetical protein
MKHGKMFGPMRRISDRAVKRAVIEAGGFANQAAENLGIPKRTLFKRLQGRLRPWWHRTKAQRKRRTNARHCLAHWRRAQLRRLQADLATRPDASHTWRACDVRRWGRHVAAGDVAPPLCLRCAAGGRDACPGPWPGGTENP